MANKLRLWNDFFNVSGKEVRFSKKPWVQLQSWNLLTRVAMMEMNVFELEAGNFEADDSEMKQRYDNQRQVAKMSSTFGLWNCFLHFVIFQVEHSIERTEEMVGTWTRRGEIIKVIK